MTLEPTSGDSNEQCSSQSVKTEGILKGVSLSLLERVGLIHLFDILLYGKSYLSKTCLSCILKLLETFSLIN